MVLLLLFFGAELSLLFSYRISNVFITNTYRHFINPVHALSYFLYYYPIPKSDYLQYLVCNSQKRKTMSYHYILFSNKYGKNGKLLHFHYLSFSQAPILLPTLWFVSHPSHSLHALGSTNDEKQDSSNHNNS